MWKSWSEFNSTIDGKKVVLFGVADDWYKKTFKRSKPDIAYIVDNSPTRKGKKYNINEYYGEVDVKDPEVLREKSEDEYIVITSGAYLSIIPQLESFGLVAGKDFCCTPALNNLKVISDFEHCDTKLLICSSEHKIYTTIDSNKDMDQTGGGLYLYDIAKDEPKKLLSGNFHQIVDLGDKYLILDEKEGIHEVSKEFEITKTFGFRMDSFSHGLAVDQENRRIYMARSGVDLITVFDLDTYEEIEDIKISEKSDRYSRDMHHMNDLWVHKGYLYVSLFSHSGNWQNGIYDGGILQIAVDDYSIRHQLVRDAWMPHSVTFIGDELYYLDSMRSKLMKGDKSELGQFSGFLRGLATDGRFFFVGESESRYFDRLAGVRNYISLTGGFYMFDTDSKAGRFYNLPTRQVRNIMVLPEDK